MGIKVNRIDNFNIRIPLHELLESRTDMLEPWAEALAAMRAAFLRLKLVVEPGGAVALAAALFQSRSIQADTVIVILSGGNVDPVLFTQSLAE